MLLYILNLPHDIRLGRLRNLISEQCGIQDVILDNIKTHEDGKRITVGLVDEVQASAVMAKINGYFLDGRKLRVEVVSKNESPWQQQQPKMPYYNSPPAAPMPYASTPAMFPPMMGQDLNASSNLPYYLTQTQTPYDYGNSSAVPPVSYPTPELPSTPIWNQMAGFQNQAFNNRDAFAGQSFKNQPMFAPNSQGKSNPQKRDFGAFNSSGYNSTSMDKRPRFDDRNTSNETGPRRNAGEETRNYDSNRSYNDRSSFRFGDRDRYDSRDQGRHGDREDRDRSRFDNRERDSYDTNRSRGYHDNSERGNNDTRDGGGYGGNRNDYSERHDSSFGSEFPRKNVARSYNIDPNNASFSKTNKFGNKSGFSPNKNQSGKKNAFNKNKFGQGSSNKSDVGAKNLAQDHSDGSLNPDKPLTNKVRDQLIKTLLFPAMQKTIHTIMNNCNNPTLNSDGVKKLRELVKSRIRDIIKKLTIGHGNITHALQLYNLYRAQYPDTEDPDVIATATNPAAIVPSSKPQATGESANLPSHPLKLNSVPPTDRLPTHPNADKNVYKQLKKEGKEVGKEDYVHPVDPKYVTVMDEEIEALRSVFIEACEPNEDKQVEKVRKEIVTLGVDKFLKFMKLHVSKRLSDDFTASIRVHFYQKAPPRPELDNFLKQYNVVSLRKNDKQRFFVATCNSAEGYDNLLAMEKAEIEGVKVTLKPFHLLGAPIKNADKKNKGNQKSNGSNNNNAGNAQAKSLNKGAQNINRNAKSAQNIDKKSENTQNVEEESKDTDNMMEEQLIDKEIIPALDVDDLEDF